MSVVDVYMDDIFVLIQKKKKKKNTLRRSYFLSILTSCMCCHVHTNSWKSFLLTYQVNIVIYITH